LGISKVEHVNVLLKSHTEHQSVVLAGLRNEEEGNEEEGGTQQRWSQVSFFEFFVFVALFIDLLTDKV
jgi:hypothetical protein